MTLSDALQLIRSTYPDAFGSATDEEIFQAVRFDTDPYVAMPEIAVAIETINNRDN